VSCGEASGPLFPPPPEQDADGDGQLDITEDMFSCEHAARRAFDSAQLGVSDIDYFSLYDCFPICFLRALEAVGLAGKGQAGDWVESKYRLLLEGKLTPQAMPVNTHGGLSGFGAPWCGNVCVCVCVCVCI
jgi:acetyl-CoA acetyltransferase